MLSEASRSPVVSNRVCHELTIASVLHMGAKLTLEQIYALEVALNHSKFLHGCKEIETHRADNGGPHGFT